MNLYKILLMSFFMTSFAHSTLKEEFPSYSYILTEFNLDENFIDDPTFKRFVYKNKKEYKRRFVIAMKRGSLIIPTLQEMMYERDISPVFLYLSMIESAFKPNATSSTGAAGLWQIVKITGAELNLKMTGNIDERYDPIKSTDAAIKYLYKINKNLNKWYLTTMAYNCGNGCVNKSIRKAGTTNLGVLINPRNNFIKKETREYIQKILLIAMIGENYLFKRDDVVGEMIHKINKDKIVPVGVRGGERLSTLASVLDMNKIFLEKINAHLTKGHVPSGRGHFINIPQSRLRMFNQRYVHRMRMNTYSKYARN